MDHPPATGEAVPLQPRGCEYWGLQVEGAPGPAPQQPPPPDFVLWSLFNTIFLNYFCCLGFLALVFSVKSRDRKMAGDLEGARHYGATAKHFNIIASVFLCFCVAATITCLMVLLI